jgi:hypothetical protein
MARLLAAAFHESVSVQRLEALFRSDWNGLFAGATAMRCPQCRGAFGVFFQSSDDPKNLEYLKTLEDLIAKDCRAGMHSLEFRLTGH